MDTTPLLGMPYLAAAQASKHVTHNEALRMLDALVQIAVESRAGGAPPGNPTEAERHIVGPSASGAWSGQENALAAWQDGAWTFFAPRAGWLAWIGDEERLTVYDGSAWQAVRPAQVPLLGINATADSQNRLALAAPTSLFNHEGAGHVLKVNKAAGGETAALHFQTGFATAAEIGCLGDEDLSIKVSADGSQFTEALRIANATGAVTATGNARLAIGIASAASWYGDGEVIDCTASLDSHGGFAGATDRWTVPYDASFLLCLTATVAETSGAPGAVLRAQANTTGVGDTLAEAIVTDHAAQAQSSVTELVSLSAGDEIFLCAGLADGMAQARFDRASLTLIHLV